MFVSPVILGLKTSCLPRKDIPDSLTDEEIKPATKNEEARRETAETLMKKC